MVDPGQLDGGTAFLPDHDDSAFEALIDHVWRKRFTTFVTVSMEMLAAAPEVCDRCGFTDPMLRVVGAPTEYRRELVGDPAFGAWLALAMLAMNEILIGSAADERALEAIGGDFQGLLDRFESRRLGGGPQAIPGTPILVQRFDIDPLIARVTPPSYAFPEDEDERRRLLKTGYSTDFFRDVAGVALRRIERDWLECHRYITRLVRILGYLPDADFRSCSASRYTGVVYLAARDASILDMEESLVHEAGHQLLYTIVEAQEIIRGDAEPADYALPWSGQVRDFYGYFHAYYIYVLLARYLERVQRRTADRSEDERRRARERLVHILRGLVAATADFRDNARFTPFGGQLCESLQHEIDELVQRNADVDERGGAELLGARRSG